MAPTKERPATKTIATNREARHEYFVLEALETGVELKGTEVKSLHQQCKLQGYTLVPLSLYFKHGRVKMEVGLCKGKKLYDKRADAAKRDAKRSIDRAVKSNGKFY